MEYGHLNHDDTENIVLHAGDAGSANTIGGFAISVLSVVIGLQLLGVGFFLGIAEDPFTGKTSLETLERLGCGVIFLFAGARAVAFVQNTLGALVLTVTRDGCYTARISRWKVTREFAGPRDDLEAIGVVKKVYDEGIAHQIRLRFKQAPNLWVDGGDDPNQAFAIAADLAARFGLGAPELDPIAKPLSSAVFRQWLERPASGG